MVGRIALCLSGLAVARSFKIEAMKHDIQQITAQNFDGVVAKFRDSAISSLWFFKDDNPKDKEFLEEYNKVATDLKGMAKVTAINCNEWKVFCDKQGVKETPTILMYPTNPMPVFTYEGKMESKAVSGKLSKLFPDFSTKLTKDNIDTFLTTDPSKPKVILLSSKKSVPSIFKALSSETVFRRSIKFGFASESDAEVVQKFKVKKFPTVIMQRGSKAEIRDEYKGELNFMGLKEWVNLYSESGMGDKVAGAGGKEEASIEEAKPWLVQEVPELNQKSQNDICFKGEGLCVIYLKDGDITNDETDMLTRLSKKFTSQLSDRGAKMKFMWMNAGAEPEFKKLFEPAMLPSAVVFNPHKRLRFAKLDHGEENEVLGNEAGISGLMDKVLGGDARFKMVPGQKLPSWSVRDEKAKKSEL